MTKQKKLFQKKCIIILPSSQKPLKQKSLFVFNHSMAFTSSTTDAMNCMIFLVDLAKKSFFVTNYSMFPGWKHKFQDFEHKFQDLEHKFPALKVNFL